MAMKKGIFFEWPLIWQLNSRQVVGGFKNYLLPETMRLKYSSCEVELRGIHRREKNGAKEWRKPTKPSQVN